MDLTEHNRAEAALLASRQRVRILWDEASDAMALSDEHGIVLDANQAYFDLYGYPPEQVIGHSFAIIFPPEQRDWALEQYYAIIRNRTVLPTYESTIRRANGEERVVESRVSFVSGDDGQVAMLSIIRDVTERALLAERLRRSEAQFKTLVENAPDIIARFDRELRHIYISPTIERVTGLPQAGFLGKTNRDLGMPEDLCALWEARTAAVFATGEPAEYEFTYETPHGPVCYQARIVPELAPDGTVETVLAITRDVTAARQAALRLAFLAEASKALSSSLDRRITLEQAARLAIPYYGDACVIDLFGAGAIGESVVAHSDPQLEQVLRTIVTHYPPPPSSSHPVAAVLRTGSPVVFDSIPQELIEENLADERHGELVRAIQPLSCAVLPLTARGRTIGALGMYATSAPRRYSPDDRAVLEELARRVAVALDNAQLYEEAQEAIREREAFLAIASHEVKNPLTALSGRAELLRRRMARDPDRAGDLGDVGLIIEQARRVNQLLSDLLDASHVASGQLAIQLASLDLSALIARTLAEIGASAPGHTITFAGPAEPLLILGDAGRLQQVLHNLLRNAIKYSPAGSTVRVAADSEAGRARVTVSDEGVGIPASELPHLFKRFYRVRRNARAEIGGSGIGLYVVKDIVGRHGGSVDVRSVEGEGSTFMFYLPLAAAG